MYKTSLKSIFPLGNIVIRETNELLRKDNHVEKNLLRH